MKPFGHITNRHVDLVLSDHYLQNELGTALAAQIKALKPDIPILLISGSEDIPYCPHVDGVVKKTYAPSGLLVANSVEADQTARTFSRHCGYNRDSAKRPEASDIYG